MGAEKGMDFYALGKAIRKPDHEKDADADSY